MTASDVIRLINPTGKNKIDNIVRDFIMRCESSFPDKILGYYLMGSQLDNSENKNSDLMCDFFLTHIWVNIAQEHHLSQIQGECTFQTYCRFYHSAVATNCSYPYMGS